MNAGTSRGQEQITLLESNMARVNNTTLLPFHSGHGGRGLAGQVRDWLCWASRKESDPEKLLRCMRPPRHPARLIKASLGILALP